MRYETVPWHHQLPPPPAQMSDNAASNNDQFTHGRGLRRKEGTATASELASLNVSRVSAGDGVPFSTGVDRVEFVRFMHLIFRIHSPRQLMLRLSSWQAIKVS